MKRSEYGPWIQIISLNHNKEVNVVEGQSFALILQKAKDKISFKDLDYLVVNGKYHNQLCWEIKSNLSKLWTIDVFIWNKDSLEKSFKRKCSKLNLFDKLANVYNECLLENIIGGTNEWYV